MKKIYLSLLIFITFLQFIVMDCANNGSHDKKDIKVLVLIITSDNFEVYKELKKLWQSYMHYDKNHVEAYFIRSNPNLLTSYEIQNDTIWCKSSENLKPGIINKTILAMEAMLPWINEFDYVLRTNLSSFYIFPRLLEFLKGCPKHDFYGGSDNGSRNIGSGCGFLLSVDLVQLMVKNKNFFINNASTYDDVLIGHFLIKHGKKLFYHNRMNIVSMDDWNYYKDKIPNNAFHFRVKNRLPHLRLEQEPYIYKQLIKMFY